MSVVKLTKPELAALAEAMAEVIREWMTAREYELPEPSASVDDLLSSIATQAANGAAAMMETGER